MTGKDEASSGHSAGLSADGLGRLHEALSRHVGDERVPGLVALVARGDQVHVEALGHLGIGRGPVQRDSVFRIASTTKPLTAAMVLTLVADGTIDLDEPVDRLLPELADRQVLRRMDGPLDETVPARRPVTTRDLLTFTFGFGMVFDMFTAPAPWPAVARSDELDLATIGPPNPAVQPDPDTWIARLGSLPLLAQPGERWMYNTGAQVLGVLAARATGLTMSDVMRERLTGPLGMPDTGFWTTATDRLATAYQPSPAGLMVIDEPDGVWSRPQPFCDTAAGLVSTVDDLLAFARMLLIGGGELLPAELARAMTSDQLTAEQKAYGGLGPGFFDHRSWGFGQAVHDTGAFGWDGGLGSSFLVDPRHDLTMVLLTQRMFESPEPPAVHSDFQAAAYAALQ
jgi:CubicO group peptidase (beta-lactamase class C family)